MEDFASAVASGEEAAGQIHNNDDHHIGDSDLVGGDLVDPVRQAGAARVHHPHCQLQTAGHSRQLCHCSSHHHLHLTHIRDPPLVC